MTEVGWFLLAGTGYAIFVGLIACLLVSKFGKRK